MLANQTSLFCFFEMLIHLLYVGFPSTSVNQDYYKNFKLEFNLEMMFHCVVAMPNESFRIELI